jgi:hypothetical protein
MELIYAHQVDSEQLVNTNFDYFIAASGYENRSTFLVDNVKIDARNRLVLAFDNNKNFLFRENNDSKFTSAGFTFIEESANRNDKITAVLENICHESSGCNSLRILIDYSCMSKYWYASILSYFIAKDLSIGGAEIFFSYTSAKFSEPLKPHGMKMLNSPMGLLKANVKAGKPRALILGLGYEKYLTSEIIKKFDYKSIYAFYSDPAIDSRYPERVVKNNKKILKLLPANHIFKYPIEDLKQTDSLLIALTMKLRLDHQVVILPAGPKPFTLSSLILASRYPDIEVWTIDNGHFPAAYNNDPIGIPMVYKLFFSNDEDSFL